jgi:hypothetical protein
MRRKDRGPSRRERHKADQERPAPHNCPDVMRVRQACTLLGELAATGNQTVLIGRMLEILDPDHKQVPKADPLADPLFGTMPTDPAAYREGNSP